MITGKITWQVTFRWIVSACLCCFLNGHSDSWGSDSHRTVVPRSHSTRLKHRLQWNHKKKKPSEENPGKEKRAEDRQRGTRCRMKGYRRQCDWVKVVHQRGPAGASSAVRAVCVMLNEYMRGEAGEGEKKKKKGKQERRSFSKGQEWESRHRCGEED